MIYILTGPIRSGKTTTLLKWAKSKTMADGLLCPDGEDGTRFFLKVESQEPFELEVEMESEETLSIGPFKFLKSAFKKANDFLMSFASENEKRYLIIDELGKLELKSQGLHQSAEILIPQYISHVNAHLILVVRDYLLDDIVMHYNISDYKLLSKENLRVLM
ncbi:nucleoside-triphosphatase [Psychroserpens damuponensis]|uniref:nucleoside-triphosphatase n=1 Tax=Psychroserpens damuponensis TaxID=943936 RepID=UPI00058DC28E|nr:nucleoside-triphosphatase [Psychroserpens damuponensis]